MENQVEDVIKIMQKIENELRRAAQTSYFGSLSAITGIATNTKENVLELIESSFEELLPLLYVIKDNHPTVDLEKIVLDLLDIKEKTKELLVKSESTVLTKAGEYRNQMADIISLFKEKMAGLG